MPWKCGYWSGGETLPFDKNSDVTVMRQWWNSDATVTEQWCIWFELFNVIMKLLNCHWSYFIVLQCLGSVFGDTRPFDQNSDQKDVKQWWDSDETVMQQWCLWFELFNIICKVLRWHWWYFILLQCIWSVIMHLLVTKDPLTKTVIRQWWDSDGTVMQQCVLRHKTFWQKQWSNRNETVMEQLCIWY
jgi:hypothetical protein